MTRSLVVSAAALLIGCGGTGTGPSNVSVVIDPAESGADGGGTVDSDLSGIDCTVGSDSATGACAASFDADAVVTLTATADAQSTFEGWINTASGNDFDYEQTLGFDNTPMLTTDPFPIDVDQDRDLVVTAVFVLTPTPAR